MDSEGSHIFVFIGSTDLPNVFFHRPQVDPKELKSYWDMVQPKWHGKIVALDPRQPGRQRIGGPVLFNIPELGEEFLTRLFSEMEVTLSRDERQAMDWLAVGQGVTVAIRPEQVNLTSGRQDGRANMVEATLQTVQFLGDRYEYTVTLGTETRVLASPEPQSAKPGDQVYLELKPEGMTLWPTEK